MRGWNKKRRKFRKAWCKNFAIRKWLCSWAPGRRWGRECRLGRLYSRLSKRDTEKKRFLPRINSIDSLHILRKGNFPILPSFLNDNSPTVIATSCKECSTLLHKKLDCLSPLTFLFSPNFPWIASLPPTSIYFWKTMSVGVGTV